MSTETSRRLLLVGIAVYVAGCIVTFAQHREYEIPILLAQGAYVAIGGLIVVRRPGNKIGLALVAYGAIWAVATALMITAESLDEAGNLDAAAWLTLFAAPLGTFTIWILTAIWLLFPDGETTTPTDAKLLRWSSVYIAVVIIMSLFADPQALPETKSYPHPFVSADLGEGIYNVASAFVVLLFLFGIFVAVRLIRRMRHGDPIERRQALWVAVAVILNVTILIANAFIQPLGTDDRAFWLIDSVAVLLIPIALGVAIFRYRLYDIDTIVSRSVTFGALALFIGGVYVAIVVGIGEFLGGDSGFGLSIVASVLVAMAFQPVRRRVERWANRLVYGERATPYEVLVRFSRRSAELSDEELLDRIPQMIVDGTGAATAMLWTKTVDGFVTGSVSPAESPSRRIVGNDHFEDPEADYSLSVFHDGELLGGLSLVKEGGETMTSGEERLLADLASGLGLALRNARLTGELRRQVVQLEASRERVLTASDEARRALENDLDSGPQQQLVALKVKLGPTRKLAERAGAEKTAKLLTQLEVEAGQAIQAVRDFAGGIYPPLLEAEGLAVAIKQQTRNTTIPIDISGDGIGRYGREIEAAAYFSVLEALQNTAKYAEAASASVMLKEMDGVLTFEVRDDGAGFDAQSVARGAGLTGMADRLDTVGGSLKIESTPGEGAVVTGAIPIRQLADT
ncbi:MAG: ATP-binding protein [Acidimicrobiales bacterium]